MLAVAVAAVSTGSIFVRLAEAPALVVSFWRVGLATALILPFGARRAARELGGVSRGELLAGVASGFFLAVHFATWIASLDHTTVAASTVIVCSTPVWVALLSPFVAGDAPGRAVLLGIAVSVAGAVVIGWGDLGADGDALFGDALALAGALAAACYVLFGRRLRPRVSLVSYVLLAYGSASGFLLLFALGAGDDLTGYAPATWGWMLALALVPQLVGHTGYNYALRWTSAALVSVTMLGEPIGATLLAWWILGEVPGAATVVGGVLILAGIARVAGAERG